MIQTKEFALTKKDYIKVLSLQRLKRSWWFFAILIIVSIISKQDPIKNGIPSFEVLYIFFYLLIIFISIIVWVYSKSNKNLYKPMQLTFGPEKLTILTGQSSVFTTPTTSEIAYDTITKKQEFINYYLLYVSKSAFLIIPQHVFKTEEDKEAFRKLLSLR